MRQFNGLPAIGGRMPCFVRVRRTADARAVLTSLPAIATAIGRNLAPEPAAPRFPKTASRRHARRARQSRRKQRRQKIHKLTVTDTNSVMKQYQFRYDNLSRRGVGGEGTRCGKPPLPLLQGKRAGVRGSMKEWGRDGGGMEVPLTQLRLVSLRSPSLRNPLPHDWGRGNKSRHHRVRTLDLQLGS